MFCQKCGTENNDSSIYCSNCGIPLKETKGKRTNKNSGTMFSGFLLNIFSVVIPAIIIFAFDLVSNSSSSQDEGGGVTIEFNADYSTSLLSLAIVIGLIIFAIGIVIYFNKNAKLRKILSLLYLIVAIADLCLLVVNTLTYILATCGLGVILYVPGILQIIAGEKYVSATREYET